MGSRVRIRSRVMKSGDTWVAVSPTGRKTRTSTWGMAMHYANEAVYHEREYERVNYGGVF